MKDSVSVIMCCYVRYLLKFVLKVEIRLCNTCTCNNLVMCTELTKPYDDRICLRQLLCIYKAEKTRLNDNAVIEVNVLNELLQTNYKK